MYLILSFYLVFGALTRRKSYHISYGGWLILIFWIIYTIRLLYDTQVVDVSFKNDDFKFYTMTFGSCLLPTVATILTTKYVVLQQAKRFFFATILLSNISILLIVLKIYGSLNPIVVATRVNFLVEASNGKEFSILNPITIGIFGETLGLFSIACILFFKNSFSKNLFYFFTTLIGIFVLALGASRGSTLSFLLLLVLLILSYLIIVKKTPVFFTRFSITMFALILFLVQVVLPRINFEELEIFQRIIKMLDQRSQGKKEVRDYQWESAWNLFLDNPIIGSRFLDDYNFYPHNVYLESLMATGIIGSTVFFSSIFLGLWLVLCTVLNKDLIIIFGLLLMILLLSNLTSGSLFYSVNLWMMLAFICSIQKSQSVLFNEKNLN